jgi:EcsC family protein
MTRRKDLPARREQGPGQVADAILDVVGSIPGSSERPSAKPDEAARKLANAAAAKAALISGGLALPPGPLGWLTILPDLIAIWRLQSQMVADIAALYGQTATLTREHMLYCLFKHAAAQAVRDLVVRAGTRAVVRRMTMGSLQRAVERIGVKVTQRAVGGALTRWIPVVGALGVGAYAYYDTAQVARTATELFKRQA